MSHVCFVKKFPFSFEDNTPIELTRTNRRGLIRKEAFGSRGFAVYVHGIPGGDPGSAAIIHLDAEMVAKLRRGPDGSLALDA